MLVRAWPVGFTAFDKLLRVRTRWYLTDSEKAELLVRQSNHCAECLDALGCDTEFDHKVALHESTGDQALEDFQALCGQCHANKTIKEPPPYVGVLRSRFSKRVWDAYVESPKQSMAVYKDEGTPDIRR